MKQITIDHVDNGYVVKMVYGSQNVDFDGNPGPTFREEKTYVGEDFERVIEWLKEWQEKGTW